MWIKIIFAVFLCISSAISFPSGAPLSTCSAMSPSHASNQPQETDLPVRIEYPEWILAGQSIKIKIIATNIESFKGFHIQARNHDNAEIIGRFETSDVVGVINCNGILNSAATHKDNSAKTELEITWEPPMTTEIIIFNFL